MDWYLQLMELIYSARDCFYIWVSQDYNAYQVLFTFKESPYEDHPAEERLTEVSLVCSGVNLKNDSEPKKHVRISFLIKDLKCLKLMLCVAERHRETFKCFYETTGVSRELDYAEALKTLKDLSAATDPKVENYRFSIRIPFKKKSPK